jgi:hypothetical protein
MKNRTSFALLPMITIAFLSMAAKGGGCQATSVDPIVSPGGDAATGEDAAPAPAVDAGTCTPVVASAYDQSCARDSDCAPVPLGSTACGACDTRQPGYLVCPSATVNKSVESAYRAAIQADWDNYLATCQPGVDAASIAWSCPAEFTPTCVNGACVVVPPGQTLNDAGSIAPEAGLGGDCPIPEPLCPPGSTYFIPDCACEPTPDGG